MLALLVVAYYDLVRYAIPLALLSNVAFIYGEGPSEVIDHFDVQLFIRPGKFSTIFRCAAVCSDLDTNHPGWLSKHISVLLACWWRWWCGCDEVVVRACPPFLRT